jgi:triosephosphate isomerase
LSLGAQDVSAHAKGAYTGQISGAMLSEVHCQYVLVGHSERRQYCVESDSLVAEKFLAAVRSGLRPILCVGETLEERQSHCMEEVVRRQLEAVVSLGGAEVFAGAVVAYEPVWAIGTGLSATPEEVQQMHAFIRNVLVDFHSTQVRPTPVLYGGSVKSDNVASLLKLPNVDGCLVGGASLVAPEFLKICERANSQ